MRTVGWRLALNDELRLGYGVEVTHDRRKAAVLQRESRLWCPMPSWRHRWGWAIFWRRGECLAVWPADRPCTPRERMVLDAEH